MSFAQLNGTHGSDSGREQAGIPDPQFTPGNTVFGNRYPKAFKLRVLEQTDACTKPGELGRYLRRNGLTHATLTCCRRQRASGTLDAAPNNRSANGRTEKAGNTQENKRRLEETRLRMDLERENRKLRRQLEQAEMIIDIQKKVARLLEIPLDEPPSGRTGSRKTGRNGS
jgi:transposase